MKIQDSKDIHRKIEICCNPLYNFYSGWVDHQVFSFLYMKENTHLCLNTFFYKYSVYNVSPYYNTI